ncbi:PREDICTED: uncharacterized protein LOC106116441 isoform X3 [Papilio xuthus]|uniref:Uncharacterized protein LOC106116441 isoform X3 n=1 Tax=Papilio xuthus TaxID=66420 RepID=A0AAJ7E780_PAPXU|nr:PREDICTED: uncharacterized protein LOC106116441 isoform X3 [Papilio xuthus]
MPVGRKRWNLHDGPQGSLRRLRNQLAEDGCAESQVVLAKQLLEEKCELEADKISNFKQALEWLICATEQAHPEARRMLRRCIRSGVIDEDSAAIVRAKSCLAASRQEIVARKAARDLFASLSNGEQYITTAQLERRIREICTTTLKKDEEDSDTADENTQEEARALDGEQALEPSLLEAGDQIHVNGTIRTTQTDEDYHEEVDRRHIRNLTVDNLVSAAVDYCQGELPLLTIGLMTLLYFGNQIIGDIQDDGFPSGLIELIGEDKSSIKNLLKNEFITDYEDNNYQITWDDYYSQCNTPSWTETNMADTQIRCSILNGAHVNWEGYISEVRLINVRNQFSDFAAWLPSFLQEYFKCYYGEEYSNLCQDTNRADSVGGCEFVKSVARQSGKICHLNNLNEYIHEIKLTMEAGGGLLKRHADISINFDHYFSNYTRLLRTDDKIRFKGILINEHNTYKIGSKDIKIQGYEINCVECKNTRQTVSAPRPTVSKLNKLIKTIINDCVVSSKYILNFLLNPIVVFK